MFIKNISIFSLVIISCYSITGCKKYLGTKPVQEQATPETIDDLQAILDNPALYSAPGFSSTGADEYYLTYPDWSSRTQFQRDSYTWKADLDNTTDWQVLYPSIFYANTALFQLDRIADKGTPQQQNLIRGSALFYRAYQTYQVAQLYAPVYDEATAATTLGIPLRLNVDFNEASTRPTLKETYAQIIKDLEEAITLLPDAQQPLSRPGKAACYAQLARTYLQMNNYTKAKENAEACLAIHNYVLSFSDINWVIPASANPIIPFNPEIIFYNSNFLPINSNSRARVDSTLYKSYSNNDLRKTVYFRSNNNGSYRFKGSYNSGSADLFNGLATDEVLLIQAECYARNNNKDKALEILNALLTKRYDNTFVPLTAATVQESLALVITERRKELVYRGTRWPDLRRLNKEPAFATTLKRELNGQIYTLEPNDLRYTLLIPSSVLFKVELPQNPR